MRYQGKIVVHHRGYGFVDLDDAGAPPTSSAFVAPPDLNPLVSGDRVSVQLEPSGKDRYQATDLQLVERFREHLFGQVVMHRGRRHLGTDRHVANTDWPLRGADDLDAGTWVVARIDGDQAVHEREVPETDVSLERVIVRYGLRTSYPEVPRLTAPAIDGRRDLRDEVTITIDAPSSRDLDDALSALAPDPSGAMRVLVHIADVDAMVPAGSALDEEAAARGTSVYLAGRTMPMLPPALSEDALSLLPGVDRLALTVELRINPEGQIRAVDIYESVIRSTARLDYATVGTWLETADDEVIDETLRPTLRTLRAVSARLAVARSTRGGVRLLSEETSIALDDETQEPTMVEARPSGPSHLLIERLMVAANEAVARWMHERGLPAMYRVHEAPEPDRVAALAEAGRRFGFELGLGDSLTPMGLAALERQFEETPHAPAFQQLLRRLLGPARYTVHPESHFGLAAPLYLHFTSPIRRYADLVVHRVIKGYLQGARDRHAEEPEMEARAHQLNQRALQARKAEMERLRVLAARWFSSRIGERWMGRVIAVKPFGLVLQLEGSGVAGTVQADSLNGGPFQVNATRDALVSVDDPDGLHYGLGQRLEVEVAGVDELLGRIDLSPTGDP